MRNVILSGAPAVAVALVVICFLLFWCGSPEGAVHWLAGRSIYVSPDEIQFQEGINRTADIRISNIASHSITVLGSALPCGCLQLDSLPIRIPSGEAVYLPLRFTGKQTAGLFYAYLATDEPGQAQVQLRIRIVE